MNDKHSKDIQEKLSFLDRIIAIFRKEDKTADLLDREFHLEPKYWPEVKEFIETLHTTIENHTIDDPNIQRVNNRIVDYILEQINNKGQIEDAEERHKALKTLTDRILSHNLNKIVGLKQNTEANTDFSDTVHVLQSKLLKRYQEEQAVQAPSKTPGKNEPIQY